MRVSDMISKDGRVSYGDLVWGHVSYCAHPSKPGWRFIPAVAGRRGSRRLYATPEEAIPAWVRRSINATARELTPIK